MKPQTVQIVRQGEATPYWFKFNPLYLNLLSNNLQRIAPYNTKGRLKLLQTTSP